MILVSRRAAGLIFAEVQRWVEEGLRTAGAPLESMVYPLSALIPARQPQNIKCPLEPVELADLQALVVDAVAIPPDSVKQFSPTNCHFSPDDPAEANRHFNLAIDLALDERPRLAVNSKLHSHPFSASPFLSGGDLYHGVSSPTAVAWRQRRGLATAILHVVYPDRDPVISERPWRLTREGAVCGRGRERVTWRIHTWGSTATGSMEDLGDARVVPDRHRWVRASRRLPYWRKKWGARWCDRQKASLREAGYRVSRNLLGRGWRRYLVEAGSRGLLIALPPDLPAAPARVLEIHDAATNRFEQLSLPSSAAVTSLTSLSLLDLIRHYTG